jgi:hypothetical protein
MASSLTSGVMGAARNVAGLGPTMMYKGGQQQQHWVWGRCVAPAHAMHGWHLL